MRTSLPLAALLVVFAFALPARAGSTACVSLGNGNVQGNALADVYPAISGDGRYVTFVSYADDLVAGDTNGVADVFVRDNATGIVERVSVSSLGVQADGPSVDPLISADGRHVPYTSHATNPLPGGTNAARH